MAMKDIPNRPRGRPRGSRNKVSKQGRKFAQRIVNDKKYREKLLSDAQAGRLPPPVQTRLMEYAWGKPPDQLTIDGELANPGAQSIGPITLVINGKTFTSADSDS